MGYFEISECLILEISQWNKLKVLIRAIMILEILNKNLKSRIALTLKFENEYSNPKMNFYFQNVFYKFGGTIKFQKMTF